MIVYLVLLILFCIFVHVLKVSARNHEFQCSEETMPTVFKLFKVTEIDGKEHLRAIATEDIEKGSLILSENAQMTDTAIISQGVPGQNLMVREVLIIRHLD